ncbi:hypothetical protein AGMMS49938_02730 [Fibrobacterales bacterium]|nr:hypothetical protein AGMMS49938_02730 [Fibrobacterales bacterium]
MDDLWQDCIENGGSVLFCDFIYPRSSSSAASSSSGKPQLKVGTFENFAECNEYYTEEECLSVDPGLKVVESTEFYGVHKCFNKLTGKSRGGLFNYFSIEYVDDEHLKLNSFIMGKQDVLKIEIEEMVYEGKPYIYPDEKVPKGFTRCDLDIETVGVFALEI